MASTAATIYNYKNTAHCSNNTNDNNVDKTNASDFRIKYLAAIVTCILISNDSNDSVQR